MHYKSKRQAEPTECSLSAMLITRLGSFPYIMANQGRLNYQFSFAYLRTGCWDDMASARAIPDGLPGMSCYLSRQDCYTDPGDIGSWWRI